MNTPYEKLAIDFATKDFAVTKLAAQLEDHDQARETLRLELVAATSQRDEARRVLLATAKEITIIHPQDKLE